MGSLQHLLQAGGVRRRRQEYKLLVVNIQRVVMPAILSLTLSGGYGVISLSLQTHAAASELSNPRETNR